MPAGSAISKDDVIYCFVVDMIYRTLYPFALLVYVCDYALSEAHTLTYRIGRRGSSGFQVVLRRAVDQCGRFDCQVYLRHLGTSEKHSTAFDHFSAVSSSQPAQVSYGARLLV